MRAAVFKTRTGTNKALNNILIASNGVADGALARRTFTQTLQTITAAWKVC